MLMAVELGSAPIEGTALTIIVTSDRPKVVVNQVMTLAVDIAGPTVAKPTVSGLEFDARMPTHNHGMLTKARILPEAEGKYKVEGVKFHMPGSWEMRLTVTLAGQQKLVVIPLKL